MNASFPFVVCAIALAFGGCAGDHLPADVRSVSLAPAARRPPVVLAPARASSFGRMANERGTAVVNQLRASIARQLAASGRFTSTPTGSGDAQITIDSLRHGLIEVSANQYAVTVSGSVAISRGAESLGLREFSGTGGEIRTLAEFEQPAVYEAALQVAFDKVAMELVTAL